MRNAKQEVQEILEGLPEDASLEEIQQQIGLRQETASGEAERWPKGALRPIGLAAGDFVVPDDFDDPLPEDILELFEGK
jgi:hypothetical protein